MLRFSEEKDELGPFDYFWIGPEYGPFVHKLQLFISTSLCTWLDYHAQSFVVVSLKPSHLSESRSIEIIDFGSSRSTLIALSSSSID